MNNVDFQSKNEKHDIDQLQKTSPSGGHERIYFRCPSCSKLYASDPSKIYVEEPEYQCSKCSTKFSISLLSALQNSEVVGVEKKPLVISENEVKPADKPAPKKLELSMTNSDLDFEEQRDSSPRVEPSDDTQKSPEGRRVQSKAVDSVQQEFDFESLDDEPANFQDLAQKQSLSSLELSWDKVLKGYEERERHNEFLNHCRLEDDIEFAIEKYSKMLKVNPNDEIAGGFLKKIELSAMSYEKLNSARQEKFFTRSFFITLAILLGGLAVIGVGLLLFQNKNIAGLGIGLIFFTFAARAFFQQRQF